MTVQPVQAHSIDSRVAQARRPARGETAPATSNSGRTGPESPRDAVMVSEQARQLAASANGEDGPRLQLDFRKLRELAFPDQPRMPAPEDRE